MACRFSIAASSCKLPQPALPRPPNPRLPLQRLWLVSSLYGSLSPEQKQAICFAYDNPLRSKVENSWLITPHKVGEFFKPDQQAMILDIFRGLHNPEFVDKAIHHVDEDAGGVKNLAVAMFGQPGHGPSEFVITGRHCTSRCDGNSKDGVAFAGPIMYGHQAGQTTWRNRITPAMFSGSKPGAPTKHKTFINT